MGLSRVRFASLKDEMPHYVRHFFELTASGATRTGCELYFVKLASSEGGIRTLDTTGMNRVL